HVGAGLAVRRGRRVRRSLSLETERAPRRSVRALPPSRATPPAATLPRHHFLHGIPGLTEAPLDRFDLLAARGLQRQLDGRLAETNAAEGAVVRAVEDVGARLRRE